MSVKVGIVVEFEAKLLESSIFKVKVVKVQLDVFLMVEIKVDRWFGRG